MAQTPFGWDPAFAMGPARSTRKLSPLAQVYLLRMLLGNLGNPLAMPAPFQPVTQGPKNGNGNGYGTGPAGVQTGAVPVRYQRFFAF